MSALFLIIKLLFAAAGYSFESLINLLQSKESVDIDFDSGFLNAMETKQATLIRHPLMLFLAYIVELAEINDLHLFKRFTVSLAASCSQI